MIEVVRSPRIALDLSVGQLDTGGQFLLWALRQRLADAEPGSARLTAGFRLAFGIAGIEPALAAFEDLLTAAASTVDGPLIVAPLCCACLTAGEAAVLGLVAAAARADAADPANRDAPASAAARLARELERAGLDAAAPRRRLLH